MKKIWVVKAGSQMICDGGPVLILSWMKQVQKLREKFNIDVVWVTSGAIASANDRTHFVGKKRTLAQKQALSAIGQPMVMDLYNLSLQKVGLIGAQVLLTGGDIRALDRKQNLQATLTQLLKWGVVPVLNENDAVATEEIQFGDNDALSAQIAVMLKAQRLVILTDVNGLYDSDPRKNKNAKLIEVKTEVTNQELKKFQNAKKSSKGTGGIYTKLLAAQNALKNKIDTNLVRGDVSNALIHIAEGESVGTHFKSRKTTK